MKSLSVHPLKTSIFQARQNIFEFVLASVPAELIQESMILAITSKIVSLAEGRLVPMTSINKKDLVEREADVFFGEIGYNCFLTVKEGLLIASAGIDESNSQTGDYILFPEDPSKSAKDLWQKLRQAWGIKNLGILITDSHTTPLRRGVSGICLSYAGFHAVRNMVGSQDLFGRELRMTQMNYADGLAATAVMLMGEGAECRPLVVIQNSEVEFTENQRVGELSIPLNEDLYFPLLDSFQKMSKKVDATEPMKICLAFEKDKKIGTEASS